MVVITASAIVGGVFGAIGWLGSLPTEFKYLIFLGGLLADAGIVSGLLGFQTGAVGALISFIMGGFVPGIIITSFQLLVVFTFLPLVAFLLKNSLAR